MMSVNSIAACSSCLKSPLQLGQEKFKGCGLCSIPKYCGKACQVAHWKHEHKRTCPGKGWSGEAHRKRLRDWVYENKKKLLAAVLVADIDQRSTALRISVKFVDGGYRYVKHGSPPFRRASSKAVELAGIVAAGDCIVVVDDVGFPDQCITTTVSKPSFPILVDDGIVGDCIDRDDFPVHMLLPVSTRTEAFS